MRTATLLAALTTLLLLVGLALGGRGGLMIALVVSSGASAWAWLRSDSLALSAVDAREVGRDDVPDLFDDISTLASRAGIPMPRVFVAASAQPNAFAAGRDPAHALVAVNEGLLQLLTREERFGVLAHEIAHIRNRDTLLMSVTAALAGAVSAVTHWGLFAGGRRNWLDALALSVLAPLAAAIVQMAISRRREYEADAVGATLCGNPLWLAGALARLESAHIRDDAVEARPAMAPLFIVRPLAGSVRDNLFSTHPDVANRIRALEEMARAMGVSARPARAAKAAQPRWRPFADALRPDAAAAAAPSFLRGRGLFAESGKASWK